MFGLHRSLPVFQAPPCMCAEIEEHVREAIAMRDEMAKWDTPLREWAKLQQMPVLTVKSEPPKPAPLPTPAFDYGYTHSVHMSTSTAPSIVRAPIVPPVYLKGGNSTIRTMEPPEYEDGTYNFTFLCASVPTADLGVQVQCRGVTYYITSMSLLDSPVDQRKVMLRTMRVY